MFDAAFFRDELPRLRAEFAQAQGETAAHVEVMLHHGLMYRVEGEIEAGPSYIRFDSTVDGVTRRTVIPYGSVLAVNLCPASQSRKRVMGLVP